MQKNMIILDIEDAQKILDHLNDNPVYNEIVNLKKILTSAKTATVTFPDEVVNEQAGTEVRQPESSNGSSDSGVSDGNV